MPPEKPQDGIHTIPVPRGWSVEQAWEAHCRGAALPADRPSSASVLIRGGRLAYLYEGKRS
jgi:hypothetical protein